MVEPELVVEPEPEPEVEDVPLEREVPEEVAEEALVEAEEAEDLMLAELKAVPLALEAPVPAETILVPFTPAGTVAALD